MRPTGSGDPAATIAAMDVCVLSEVPRPAETETGDQGHARRAAALTSAFHAGSPVLLGWRRAADDGPITVHIGGAALLGPPTGERRPLALPMGGYATPTTPAALMRDIDDIPAWVQVAGHTYPSSGQSGGDTAETPPSLEDCLLGVWRGPFAWLLIAEPLTGVEIAGEIEAVADRERALWRRTERSPETTIATDRLRDRHRELESGSATGAWWIRLYAGATTSAGARGVAGLLCASADLRRHAYALRVHGEPGTFTGLTATPHRDDGPSSPFLAGTPLLAALARPPLREIPGVRFAIRPDFDVTPENRSRDGVLLGTVLDGDRGNAGDLVLAHSSLNRHTFVCGATGAGKSQTTRGLLESATGRGIPWLVIEPAKAEYRAMAARLDGRVEVIAIRPGAVDDLPAGINPLEPGMAADGRRFPLQTHADMVRSLFLAAFQAEEPFPQVLSATLTRCYTELGWDLALGEPTDPSVTPRYPTLRDVQRTAELVVRDIGYGKEITDNVLGFIRVRLSSLRLGTTGRFLEGGHRIDFGRLLERNVVLEIEDVGDDQDKAFLMGIVLIRLTEHLRLEHRPGSPAVLRHLTVFEEAHRLLRRTEGQGPASHAVEMFAGLLAEIRAYGEGLVIAEQIPAKLVPDVIKNTAVKIVHRLPAQDDRDAVGATMNISPAQSDYLVTLPEGVAAVFANGMDFPVITRMPNGSDREKGHDPVPAAPVVEARSITCAAPCRTRPCTLRQIRHAQRLLEAEPRLELWAELAVVAHLTGWPTPAPRAELATSLDTIDPRLLGCAVSHAVDAAVAARGTAIADRITPDALAAHIIAVFDEVRASKRQHRGMEPEWSATAYRWSHPLDVLTRFVAVDAAAGRHPDSTAWARAYGREIPGADAAAQLRTVRAWQEQARRDPRVVETLPFGVETPDRLREAVRAIAGGGEWRPALTRSLQDFAHGDGIVHELTR